MNLQKLIEQIKQKKSYLCIGLDSDPQKIPAHLKKEKDPVLAFNKQIIEATKDLCVAYKINTAFYEIEGTAGWQRLEETLKLIPQNIFTIADAKRGDIGNTGKMYAKAFLETIPFDSVTVAPYMGRDSIEPFLQYKGKWAIVLGLTSNPGAEDFQYLECGGKKLYNHVLEKASKWGNEENLMFVIGATRAAELAHVRKIVPGNFLLVPGVGAQGGNLKEVSEHGLNANCGLLVNVSRGIIFAGKGQNFANDARKAAQQYQQEMAQYLKQFIGW